MYKHIYMTDVRPEAPRRAEGAGFLQAHGGRLREKLTPRVPLYTHN